MLEGASRDDFVKVQYCEDLTMKQKSANFNLIVALLLCAIAGSTLVSCATVSRDVRREAATEVTFADLRRNPEQYVGETVILGGYILETRNFEDETRLLVIQAPLSVREEPKERDLSEGRFILVYVGFLDPEIYERDRKITVAGEVLGSEEARIDGRRFVMPRLRIREIHLWADPRETRGFYYHEPFYHPWGYPHFRHRSYPYRW